MAVYEAKYDIKHGSCAGFGVFDDETKTSQRFNAETDGDAIGQAANYASVLQRMYMTRRDGTTEVSVLNLAREGGSKVDLELRIKGE